MDLVPRAEVPDMPDLIIAATAVAHPLSLVSQDSEIRASAALKGLISVVW
jgi:predicted nucleic acid-binding protein